MNPFSVLQQTCLIFARELALRAFKKPTYNGVYIFLEDPRSPFSEEL